MCAILAGVLVGWNRSEHGHAAGLRTTILVSLAACVAMIQVNLLLPIAGKPSSSFVMLDLMRLPLGILSGMGFIGAGAIVRRDNFVTGVTTAATMWFVTVIGLCFGGGQLMLGLVGLAIGMIVLEGLKAAENRMKQEHQGKLSIVADSSGPGEEEIRASIEKDGLKISSCALSMTPGAGNRELSCDLRWRAAALESKIPAVVHTLAKRPGVIRIAWTPQAR
ncbi:MAG: MgtC/SapB family protein [bacterium]